jgi:hypothetical protein
MNLTNKQIQVISLSTNMVTNITVAKISISEQVAPEINKLISQYDLTFNDLYTSPSDPALLSAINEKLALLPD